MHSTTDCSHRSHAQPATSLSLSFYLFLLSPSSSGTAPPWSMERPGTAGATRGPVHRPRSSTLRATAHTPSPTRPPLLVALPPDLQGTWGHGPAAAFALAGCFERKITQDFLSMENKDAGMPVYIKNTQKIQKIGNTNFIRIL